MSNTKISWADKVWNPVTGCTRISAGCQNCYAERMAKRLAGRCGYPGNNPFNVTLHPERLEEPLRWKKPSRIFVCSMGDLFHKDVPREYICRITNIIEHCPHHTFLCLTKRPERLKILASMGLQGNDILPNLWLGVSVEDQQSADERIPLLLRTPATHRFISYEPAIGPMDFRPYLPHEVPSDHIGGTGYTTVGLNWIVMGGESGPRARPMQIEWARSVRNQCKSAGVAFFMKQMSKKAPIPEDLNIREFPNAI